MPKDYPTRYSVNYPESQETKEKLTDAALLAAHDSDTSILSAAIKEEYKAAAERSGVREKQGDFLFAVAHCHAENAADEAKGEARGLAKYHADERNIKADEYADAATHRIEMMEDFLSDIAGSRQLRQEAQETFQKILNGEGRIDPDSHSHFEVHEIIQHLSGYVEQAAPHVRTSTEQFSIETISHAASHAMYIAQEYQNLGQPHERDQAVEDIAVCAAIAAAAGHIARHEQAARG